MTRITITQIDWNGHGDERILTRWVRPSDVEYTLRRIAAAFNMDHTVVKVG